MNYSSGDIFDVIIIGGGFAGAAMAFYLTRSGLRVCLLEANEICGGSSGACAGRVQLVDSHPGAYLDMVIEGHNRLQSLEEELQVDWEWQSPGHLTLLKDEESWQIEQTRLDQLVKHGIRGEMLDQQILHKIEPELDIKKFIGASWTPEGHINPFHFCFGLIHAAQRAGANIQIYRPITGFKYRGNIIQAVETPLGAMTADVYLVASGAWSAKVLSFAGINFPVKFTHAEAMITEPLLPVLNHHISLSGFYQSVHQGNFTVGLGVGQHRRGSLLISNAIRKMEEVGNTSTAWSMPALAKAVLEILPCLVNCSVLRSWAAPSPFLPDHKPALGWLPGFENLYITAGFHLAIPTIPLLCEAAANEITTGDRSSLLQDFQPGRFAKMDLSDQTRTDHI